MLIDSHVHLDDHRYDGDRTQILARGRDAGVGAFVTIGCDLATSRAAVKLAECHSNVYATVGVHPHEVKHIENPRIEAEVHFYDPHHDKLYNMGWRPTRTLEEELTSMFEHLIPFKKTMFKYKEYIIPKIKWRPRHVAIKNR